MPDVRHLLDVIGRMRSREGTEVIQARRKLREQAEPRLRSRVSWVRDQCAMLAAPALALALGAGVVGLSVRSQAAPATSRVPPKRYGGQTARPLSRGLDLPCKSAQPAADLEPLA